MTGAARAFGEWWAERYPADHPDGIEFDKEDLSKAFAAGWESALSTELIRSTVIAGWQAIQSVTDEPWGTCDWGDCYEISRGWRWAPGRGWVPVCSSHLVRELTP